MTITTDSRTTPLSNGDVIEWGHCHGCGGVTDSTNRCTHRRAAVCWFGPCADLAQTTRGLYDGIASYSDACQPFCNRHAEIVDAL